MEKTITVTGEANLTFAPDSIIISAQLSQQERDYSLLLEKSAEQLNELTEAMKGCGFDPKQLKTTSFSTDTVYEYTQDGHGQQKRVFAGYRCTQALSLQFNLDMQKLKQVLGALFACKGAPEYSVQFTLSDNKAAKDKALAGAAADAQGKARVLAEAFGKKLGELVSVSCTDCGAQPVCRTEFMMARASLQNDAAMPDITPGDVEINEQISCVYALA